MELKFIHHDGFIRSKNCSNRTFMELKLSDRT